MRINLRTGDIQLQHKKGMLPYLFVSLESGTGQCLQITQILDHYYLYVRPSDLQKYLILQFIQCNKYSTVFFFQMLLFYSTTFLKYRNTDVTGFIQLYSIFLCNVTVIYYFIFTYLLCFKFIHIEIKILISLNQNTFWKYYEPIIST